MGLGCHKIYHEVEDTLVLCNYIICVLQQSTLLSFISHYLLLFG